MIMDTDRLWSPKFSIKNYLQITSILFQKEQLLSDCTPETVAKIKCMLFPLSKGLHNRKEARKILHNFI